MLSYMSFSQDFCLLIWYSDCPRIKKKNKKIILSEPSIRQKIIINTNGAVAALHMLTHFPSPSLSCLFIALETAACSFSATQERRMQSLLKVATVRRTQGDGNSLRHLRAMNVTSLFLCFFQNSAFSKTQKTEIKRHLNGGVVGLGWLVLLAA